MWQSTREDGWRDLLLRAPGVVGAEEIASVVEGVAESGVVVFVVTSLWSVRLTLARNEAEERRMRTVWISADRGVVRLGLFEPGVLESAHSLSVSGSEAASIVADFLAGTGAWPG
jgi:hypothetical protein